MQATESSCEEEWKTRVHGGTYQPVNTRYTEKNQVSFQNFSKWHS